MATMKVYRNGVKTYRHGVGTHERAPRSEIRGWTAETARRQRDWLWTVDAPALDGAGYAVTLTMLELPASSEEWSRMRRAWLKRAQRWGATRIHWVVEWQARGVPHLHAAVYVDRPGVPVGGPYAQGFPLEHWPVRLETAWIEVVRGAGYSASFEAQDMKPIEGSMGWLKYLAKHASRGAAHYQRQGIPEGWEKSGRMWGHLGEWPTLEPIEIGSLSNEDFWRLRRILRGWAVADARKAGDRRRVAYLKRAGRPPEKHRSAYQGVSEWIPEDVTFRVIEWLRDVAIDEGSIR